ncbi:MAG TPA: PilZ domain-containing protein [Solirubrobacteraceae bacterium]|jgi:c-di-GMP-binding flagellar brake protein YcgR
MRPLRTPEQVSEESVQRRQHVRVVRARPVTIRRGVERTAISTYSIDLSGLGILLAGPDTLSLEERVGFRLSLSDNEPPIVGQATVVRLDPRGYRAIRLEDLVEVEQRRLVRFVFDCQREDRRRQREQEGRDVR